jgi:hypothetical protein
VKSPVVRLREEELRCGVAYLEYQNDSWRFPATGATGFAKSHVTLIIGCSCWYIGTIA